MEPFTTIRSVAAVLDDANIDTDIIFPARFLLITEKTGLGQYAFYEKRTMPDGSPRPEFVLNTPPFDRARILIVGDNFGCGSSREQAPWALHEFGVRCLISTGFGEIFQANCFKNGMLPIVMAVDDVQRMMQYARSGRSLTVDLVAQTVTSDDETVAFCVAPWQRDALLEGLDEIALIERVHGIAIDAFERRQRLAMPWLYTAVSEQT